MKLLIKNNLSTPIWKQYKVSASYGGDSSIIFFINKNGDPYDRSHSPTRLNCTFTGLNKYYAVGEYLIESELVSYSQFSSEISNLF